jgi:hypothetical protein
MNMPALNRVQSSSHRKTVPVTSSANRTENPFPTPIARPLALSLKTSRFQQRMVMWVTCQHAPDKPQ